MAADADEEPVDEGRNFRSKARTAPDLQSALATLGDNVRSARRRAELTQEEAASRAEVDYKHWQAVEAGKVNATVATLLGIAKGLGVSVADLLVGVGG